MEEIYIPQLTKAPQKTEVLQVQENLPELETLTPVRGQMRVTHKGNYLEVSAQVETIITLTCYRCLQQFNHRLVVKPSELIWLENTSEEVDAIPLEREVALSELLETLPPDGYFNPTDWLYQQMSLAIPQRQVCDADCAGIQVESNVNQLQDITDKRWATLETLKNQMQNGNR